MKIYPDIIQGSQEWFDIRLGRVTGSRFGIAKSKKGVAGRKKYLYDLANERRNGKPTESYSNAVMQRGIEIEPEGRDHYEKINGLTVNQVGFIEYNEYIGVSPDGLVGDDGAIEIKAPNTTTHLETIALNRFDPKYKPQVQGLLWVTGRKWVDCISYDPRDKQVFWCRRAYRDQPYIDEMQISIYVFVEELKELMKKLTPDCPF